MTPAISEPLQLDHVTQAGPDENGIGEDDDDADEDERATKRQRLDESDLGPEDSIEDEAVLALAAHNNATSADSYQSE